MDTLAHKGAAAPARKTELGWLNLAFCAMVLGSHCSGHPISTLDPQSWQFALVYLLQRLSFVSVYGFFLISGIKLTLPRGRRVGVWDYYRGRFKSIFLPYLLAVAVYYWWFCGLLGYFEPSARDFLGYLVRGDLISPFYFVTALLQFVLLMPLLRWVAEHISPALSLPLALAVSWMSELYFEQFLQLFDPDISFAYGDRVFTTYLFYYLAGCYIGQRYEEFVAVLRKNRYYVCGAFAVFACFDLWLSYRARVLGLWSPLWAMAHLTYLLAGIAFCFLAAASIRREMPRLLKRVDRAGYLIYLYHALAIDVLAKVLRWLGIGGVGVPYAIRIAVVFTLVPLACCLWQRVWGSLRNQITAAGQSGGRK